MVDVILFLSPVSGHGFHGGDSSQSHGLKKRISIRNKRQRKVTEIGDFAIPLDQPRSPNRAGWPYSHGLLSS